MGEVVKLPVSKGKEVSPSQQGRDLEKDTAKSRDMRRHPASGALEGWEGDLSDEDEVWEIKLATGERHTINLSQVVSTFQRAEMTRREAGYVIYWQKANLTMECNIRRGRP